VKRLLLDQGLPRSTPGILIQEGLDASALAELLQAVWGDIEDALTAGAMVTVTDRAIRVRRLPILKS
jgi:hypothetical protein